MSEHHHPRWNVFSPGVFAADPQAADIERGHMDVFPTDDPKLDSYTMYKRETVSSPYNVDYISRLAYFPQSVPPSPSTPVRNGGYLDELDLLEQDNCRTARLPLHLFASSRNCLTPADGSHSKGRGSYTCLSADNDLTETRRHTPRYKGVRPGW